MSDPAEQIVTEAEAGARLDRWIKRRSSVTQGEIEKLLRTGQIRVDGSRVKANLRLEAGQAVRLPPAMAKAAAAPPPPNRAAIKKSDADFIRALVIHDDKEMVVLNKPSGLAVQGGTGQGRHVDGLLDALAANGHRPRLVHRLDKDTSGVLVLARTPAAAARLGALFRGRSLQKVYWAVTVTVPNPRAGQVRSWMVKGTGPGELKEKMQSARQGEPGARHAITDYSVISQAAQRAAWVALKPETGRMHQLRFHMMELDTAILGDRKYKTEREVPTGCAPGLHLHARALILPPGPATGLNRPLTLTAPLPPHMRQTFDTLGFLESEAGRDPLAVF
ncbi:MAG: RluA family pseudouridine synthase [Pseudomonadota bacterium]